MIQEAGLPLDAAILDVGGGTSKLAGQLLAAGYRDVTVVTDHLAVARGPVVAVHDSDRISLPAVRVKRRHVSQLLGRRRDRRRG